MAARESGQLLDSCVRRNDNCGSASHIGVFGEGPGEGVFAKTPSPEILTSAPSACPAVNLYANRQNDPRGF